MWAKQTSCFITHWKKIMFFATHQQNVRASFLNLTKEDIWMTLILTARLTENFK
jgi:hypothetical protein